MITTTPTPASGRRRPRGYSKAFRPHGGVGKRYLLDNIPAGLWVTIRARAKREGVSMRALILQLLTDWVNRPEGGHRYEENNPGIDTCGICGEPAAAHRGRS